MMIRVRTVFQSLLWGSAVASGLLSWSSGDQMRNGPSFWLLTWDLSAVSAPRSLFERSVNGHAPFALRDIHGVTDGRTWRTLVIVTKLQILTKDSERTGSGLFLRSRGWTQISSGESILQRNLSFFSEGYFTSITQECWAWYENKTKVLGTQNQRN